MSGNSERPPVEALSDVSWARIERNVFAGMEGTVTGAVGMRDRTPERKRSWLWLAIPVAAAAAALLVLSTRGGNTPTTETARTDAEPARVVAGAAPSAVSFGDAHITLDADSALVMDRDGDKPTALLEHGAAWFSIAPRADRPAFQVRAGDLLVKVVGTRFRVARDGEHAWVEVDHGIVEVRFRGSVVKVADGQSWSSDKPNDVANTHATPEPEIQMEPVPARTPTRHGEPKRTGTGVR